MSEEKQVDVSVRLLLGMSYSHLEDVRNVPL